MSRFTPTAKLARLAFFALATWFIWNEVGQHKLALAQEAATSTPVRAELPTLAPPVVELMTTATPTRTPTPEGLVLLEAKASAGDVNVRANPDISAERLGSIRAGRTYQVFGRYFRWIQFQYDDAPAGPVRGWVFDELVEIIGDPNAIPNLQPGEPTPPVNVVPAEELALTPGSLLTATASIRILSLPGAELSSSGGQQGVIQTQGGESIAQPLPTYTYPPDLAILALSANNTDSLDAVTELKPADPERIPPIAPIVLLGTIGLLGLVISSLRR